MLEVDCAYEFIGEDGTRAVLGNGDAAKADPDWCGLLDPSSGITGLIEGGEVRTTSGDKPAKHGGYAGAGLLAARNGTVQGVLAPNELADRRRDRKELLDRATYALNGDGILRWTPTGGPQRMVRFRTRSRNNVQGRIPKTFQFTLETADAVNLATVEKAALLVGGLASAETGFTDPFSDPLYSLGGANSTVVAINAGNTPTYPRFIFEATADFITTTLRITNLTTNQQIAFGDNGTADILNGTVLNFNTADGTITGPVYTFPFDDGNWYGILNPGVSTWWTLAPGPNLIRVDATNGTSNFKLSALWRDAYL